MKNTDKKNVFTLAWQFAHQTGYHSVNASKKRGQISNSKAK